MIDFAVGFASRRERAIAAALPNSASGSSGLCLRPQPQELKHPWVVGCNDPANKQHWRDGKKVYQPPQQEKQGADKHADQVGFEGDTPYHRWPS